MHKATMNDACCVLEHLQGHHFYFVHAELIKVNIHFHTAENAFGTLFFGGLYFVAMFTFFFTKSKPSTIICPI